jgi:hypothetical protein
MDDNTGGCLMRALALYFGGAARYKAGGGGFMATLGKLLCVITFLTFFYSSANCDQLLYALDFAPLAF